MTDGIPVNVLSTNASAIGLAKALNFHHDGTLVDLAVKDGAFVDLVWHSYFLGSSPPLQGIAFPHDEEFGVSAEKTLTNLDVLSPSFRVRDATLAGKLNSACVPPV